MCDVPVPALSRRRFLSRLGLLTAGAAGAALVPGVVRAADGVGQLESTPRQILGPYYPKDAVRLAHDPALDDLTRVPGVDGVAAGRRLLLHGTVTDLDGRPLSGARVEIWQACNSGRYLHPGDRHDERHLDPAFGYFGAVQTDAQGRYAFKTIVPPSYPSGIMGWTRPPHVHFRTWRGDEDHVTQCYFDDPTDPDNVARFHELNRRDLELRRVSRARRRELTVVLGRAGEEPVDGPAARLARVAESAGTAARFGQPRVGRFDLALGASG